MEIHNVRQQPNIDFSNFDEHFEIRMDYDRNGNLTRIRKVHRNAGCAIWVAIFMIAGVLTIAYYLFK